MDIRDFGAKSDSVQNAGQSDFIQAALHECWPGGPIVSRPEACRDVERDTWRNTDSLLPDLKIVSEETSGETQLAGKTFRNSRDGIQTDERDALLEKRLS